MAAFEVIPLKGGAYLVEGTDDRGTFGSVVLMSQQWAKVVALRNHRLDLENYNQKVLEIFGPILDAVPQRVSDPWSTVVVETEVEGLPGRNIDLDPDGIVLHILSEGRADLLRWVSGELYALDL